MQKQKKADDKLMLYEQTGFTRFLLNHINILSQVLDIKFTNIAPKTMISDAVFEVGLLATTNNKQRVLIENESSKILNANFDQVLSYIKKRQADISILILENPTPFQASLVNWLNSVSKNVRFYLVKMEFLKKDQKHLPQFSIKAKPKTLSKLGYQQVG